MSDKFPEDFIFGAATAAFQAEGAADADGRGPCYWDEYLKRPESHFDGDTASDFYHKYKEDIAACRCFGINGIRISLAWTRIMPEGQGRINESGLAFYEKLIDECLANGVEPFVTLHHFDTPLPLFKRGDWLNRQNIDAFAAFARVCFERFGKKVKKWITINEPYSLAAGQYIIGHFPPNIKYDVPKAVQAMHNMMVAHSKVVNLYKQLNLPGEIGIVHILEGKYAFTDNPADKKAAELDDMLSNTFMLDACLAGGYRPQTMAAVKSVLAEYDAQLLLEPEDMTEILAAARQLDFLGVNYYTSHFVEHHDGDSGIVHNGTGKKGSSVFCLKHIGKRVKNSAIPATDWDWAIYPAGLYEMLLRLKTEYADCPSLYITENGLGAKEELSAGTVADDARIDYIYQHLQAVLRAIAAGVKVKGYFLWSLMDVLSWTNGYNKRYGLFYVDFSTQQRYPKKSAYWFKAIADRKCLMKTNTNI